LWTSHLRSDRIVGVRGRPEHSYPHIVSIGSRAGFPGGSRPALTEFRGFALIKGFPGCIGVGSAGRGQVSGASRPMPIRGPDARCPGDRADLRTRQRSRMALVRHRYGTAAARHSAIPAPRCGFGTSNRLADRLATWSTGWQTGWQGVGQPTPFTLTFSWTMTALPSLESRTLDEEPTP
jgi:hypothetical protein